MIHNIIINVETSHELDVVDITDRIAEVIANSGIKNGLINIFAQGSTCAVTTMEYEPGLIKDLGAIFQRIAPNEEDFEYLHQKRWNDNNGHSHIRASMIGQNLSLPILEGVLKIGNWQQIVLIELDIKKRERELVLTLVGDL